MILAATGALLLLLITAAVGQENEVECLTQCGDSARILAVVPNIQSCCRGIGGEAFNFPGSGSALTCASCQSYRNIVGEIGFQFDRETITINDDLQADCVVATQAGLRNPRADITWLGPDGSVYNSSQGVPFETVTKQGVEQQEARLPLSFKPFGPGDAAEYSCLATITSDDFPGSETQVFRTVEIPTRVDTSTIPVPVYPSPEDNVPLAGQEYTIDCSVQSPGVPLTNDDISWSGPGGPVQGPPGRVFVDDVFQDSATGRWVRRLTFSPLSTEDSGPYTCISPQGTRVQTLTVNVPMPNTTISSVPPTAVEDQPLQIDCTSAVPPNLEGVVTVTLLDDEDTVLAQSTGVNNAEAVFNIPRASASDSGNYTCRVTVRSSFLRTNEGVDRPLEDTATLPVPFTTTPSTPVNECIEGQANCDVNAICIDLPEGFLCNCSRGFFGSGFAGDCTDIDECAGETVVACSPNEICRNIIGSFVCEPEPPSPAVPDSPVTPSEPEPSRPSPGSPITPASPDIPSDSPSVAPQPSEPTIDASDEPVPPVPGLPPLMAPEDDDCNLQCRHLNAECRRNGGDEECVCREGYVGDGEDCCIPSSLLDILKRQQEMIDAGTEEGGEDGDDDEEDGSSKKGKKKGTKGKKKGARSKKGRGRRSHRRRSKKRKSCKEDTTRTSHRCMDNPEDPVQMDPAVVLYNIILQDVPAGCYALLRSEGIVVPQRQ
jgi:hypothetical protein